MFWKTIKIAAAVFVIAVLVYAWREEANYREGRQIWEDQVKANSAVRSFFLKSLSKNWSIETLEDLLGSGVVQDDLKRYTALIEAGARLGEFQSCNRYGVVGPGPAEPGGANGFLRMDCQFENGKAQIEFGEDLVASPMDIVYFKLTPK